MDWQANVIDDDGGLARILREARTVAVLGAKGEAGQPAFYVPAYLKAHGTPRTLADLAGHVGLTYVNGPHPRTWRLTDRQGRHHDVRVSGPLQSNGGDLILAGDGWEPCHGRFLRRCGCGVIPRQNGPQLCSKNFRRAIAG